MLRILVDENIPAMTVAALRQAGHDVADLRGTMLEGSSDEALWVKAQGEKRLLITTDKGFATQRDLPHHGILIVRLRQPNRHRIHARVVGALADFPEEEWPGLLVVMRDVVRTSWRLPRD